ncbi:endonuclease/exonuclease/phosphatase family [Microscilla marina ATCC 23134]|uniref:Endonuclease/exonuclease/phosphatase family n=2 Tax=Microscilla marina TaxID=1027 RepID=A1ZLD8_MICM2|nr:endonuclease/exonuclease/phosphatase family [Microscilla marina ATCC 23134]
MFLQKVPQGKFTNQKMPLMPKFEKISAALLLVFALLVRFPLDYFLFDIVHSFAIQIVVLYLCVAILSFIWQKKWLLTSSLLSSVLMSTLFIQWFWQSHPDPKNVKGTAFKVAHFNVWKRNTQHQKVITVAKNTEADIISFEEVNNRWWQALKKGLGNTYPHQYVVTRDDNFGIAMFSKFEMQNTQAKYFSDLPSITTTISMPFGQLHWVSSHVLPPKSNDWYQRRNSDLVKIAVYMKGKKGYKLAVGDYNVVSWSPVIQRFKKTANLLDSRREFSPSYPAWSWLLGVPIDHIFHSPNIQCLSFGTTETTPSDHWGIVGQYKAILITNYE